MIIGVLQSGHSESVIDRHPSADAATLFTRIGFSCKFHVSFRICSAGLSTGSEVRPVTRRIAFSRCMIIGPGAFSVCP